MILGGRWQDRVGPRKVATVGAILVGLGFILSSLIVYFPHPVFLYLTIGVIAGAGCGLSYTCPIPTPSF